MSDSLTHDQASTDSKSTRDGTVPTVHAEDTVQDNSDWIAGSEEEQGLEKGEFNEHWGPVGLTEILFFVWLYIW